MLLAIHRSVRLSHLWISQRLLGRLEILNNSAGTVNVSFFFAHANSAHSQILSPKKGNYLVSVHKVNSEYCCQHVLSDNLLDACQLYTWTLQQDGVSSYTLKNIMVYLQRYLHRPVPTLT